MAFTSINIHDVKKIEAEHRRSDLDGSDYVKLRTFDVRGESFELNIYADGLRNFEALASAINAAQVTVDQVEGVE